MNGSRYAAAATPEGRLAAIVMELFYANEERNRREGTAHIVDYADLEAALQPYVRKELLHVQLEEVRSLREKSRNALVAREQILYEKLAEVEGRISLPRTPGPGHST